MKSYSAAQQEADAQRRLTRRSLYVAQINKAQRFAETAGGAERLKGLLATLRPASAEEDDLRGWEWRYLASQLDTSTATLVDPEAEGVGRATSLVAWPPDRVAAGYDDGVVRVFDTRTGDVVVRLDQRSPLRALTLAPDGDRLYVPMDQLALSPQCGFSSGASKRPLEIEDQVAKLGMIVELARELGDEGILKLMVTSESPTSQG